MSEQNSHPDERVKKPTSVRYQIVAMATLMAFMLYLHRFFLSFLVPYITEDFSVSEFLSWFLLNIFFFSYSLGQVPSGWFSDRFGARTMLTIYILAWSILTGLMGISYVFFLLLLWRFLFGFAQAGAYPTGASIVSKWMPFSARGTASSIIAVGGRCGGAFAPILTAFLLVFLLPASTSSEITPEDILSPNQLQNRLDEDKDDPSQTLVNIIRGYEANTSGTNRREILAFALNKTLNRKDLYQKVDYRAFELPREARSLAEIPDSEITEGQVQRRNRHLLEAVFPKYIRKLYGRSWRPISFIYCILGVLTAGLFWLVVRNRPSDHPRCNQSEAELIDSNRLALSTPHGKVKGLPLKYIVRSRSLILSSISQFGTNFGWIFLALLLPIYLMEVHNVPPLQRGVMSMLPLFFGMFGMLSGGFLTDFMVRQVGLKWGRRWPMAMTRFTAMAAYIVCLWLNSPWSITIALCFVAISTDLGTASIWAFKQDVGGRHVGSILGWGNMWGNFGAFVSPFVLLAISGSDKWTWRFIACALAFAVSGIAAMGVDATIPVAPEEDDEEKT